MPSDSISNRRPADTLGLQDRLGELRDVTEALDGLHTLTLGETPSRDEIAALFLLIREAIGTRLSAAERALSGMG